VCLAVLVPLLTSGCSRDQGLATAVSPRAIDLGVATPNLASRAVDAGGSYPLEIGDRWRHGGRSRAAVIAEAKQALLAVLSSEQVYFQREVTFTDAADIADIRVKLGADLSEASPRWAFSVSDASLSGFVARAVGRVDTKAKGLVVTLSYQRGQSLVWKVEKTRRT
jgi:hypothetical protein